MAVGFEYFKTNSAPNLGPTFERDVRAIAPAIFMFCYRNNNRNVVVYEAVLENGVIKKVEGYWLMMETDKKYEAFNKVDRDLAWRYKYNNHKFSFGNFDKEFVVLIKNGSVKLFTTHNGEKHHVRSLELEAVDITPKVIANTAMAILTGKNLMSMGIVSKLHLNTYNQTTKMPDTIQLVP